MKAQTKAFGEIEVDERQRLLFPNGLLGFEVYKKFVLLDAEQKPFYWLQSTEAVQTAFVLIYPEVFRPDYDPGITEEDLEDLGIKNEKDLLIFAIVTVQPDGKTITANLQGPLIINKVTRVGKQIIARKSEWKTRHNVIQELNALRTQAC